MKYDPKDYPVLGLCSGIEGFELAAESLGLPVVATAEIDEDANTVAFLNSGRHPFGDIRLLKGGDLPKARIVLAGSSCKGWSHIGQQLGFAHPEGDLLLHCIRLAKECHADLIVTENVPNLVGHANCLSLKIINRFLVRFGFTPFEGRILNSAHWGLATARKRWFACSFRQGLTIRPLEWPSFKKPPVHLRSVLMREGIDDRLYANSSEFIATDLKRPRDPYSPMRVGNIKKSFRDRAVWGLNAPGPTFLSGMGGPGGPSGLFQMDDGRLRRLDPKEMLSAMGFPAGYRMPFHSYRGGRLVGNALCPPVAASAIATGIKAMTGVEVPS